MKACRKTPNIAHDNVHPADIPDLDWCSELIRGQYP